MVCVSSPNMIRYLWILILYVHDDRSLCVFCQAEDGIRDLVRSRGLGDVYKRQPQLSRTAVPPKTPAQSCVQATLPVVPPTHVPQLSSCLLYTSDAADERSSVDLGGRRIIKKKKSKDMCDQSHISNSKKQHYKMRRRIPLSKR